MSDRPFADQFGDHGLDTLAEEEMRRCHERGFHRPERRGLLMEATYGQGPRYIWVCADCGESLYEVPE